MYWRKYWMFGAGLLLLFILFSPAESSANSKETYEVGNQVLNVREAPSRNANIIGTLSGSDTITVFQEKHGWVQTYYGGKEAWVAKHYLIPLTHSSQKSQSTRQSYNESATIQANGVRIRTGPGTDYRVIDIAAAGDTFQISGTDGEWHKIVLGNGSAGWVASWLTDFPAGGANSQAVPSPASAQTSNGSLSGLKIVVDPGHGGKDVGAIGLNGVHEKDLITSTAEYVAEELRRSGADVTLTRNGDYFVSLGRRSSISNTQAADAFISLHYNSFPILAANGIRTYYNSNGQTLAQQLQGSLASNLPLDNGGTHYGDYRVLRNTAAPAVLLELGFISNPNDLQEVQTPYYQSNAAQAITNGLKQYFN
ncbi:N-acetylmuramoyl-L-alanine amidase [Virgibacillus sediminis]|uniref:N-acetylmuramoyl-L-alanine amidase n=1 Tax=Virgibacillus sediminis TaxID=202260 RepID=A0ABV7A835_9BACI